MDWWFVRDSHTPLLTDTFEEGLHCFKTSGNRSGT